MSSLSWWRSWNGAPTDHKWAVIAKRSGVKVGIVSAIAWALMDYASQNKDRGSIKGFDVETYSVYSGFEEKEIESVISAMEDKEMIVDGKFYNWEKRQPKREDDSSERVAHFRQMKRNVTQCNAPDKDTDKETESETESESETERDSARAQEPIEFLSGTLKPLQEMLGTNDPDPFDLLQAEIEGVIGLPQGADAVKAIQEFLSIGAEVCDIREAADWYRSNGKTIHSARSLIGPVRTAVMKRKQQARSPTQEISGKNGKSAAERFIEQETEKYNASIRY
jgi:hypothetical protein